MMWSIFTSLDDQANVIENYFYPIVMTPHDETGFFFAMSSCPFGASSIETKWIFISQISLVLTLKRHSKSKFQVSWHIRVQRWSSSAISSSSSPPSQSQSQSLAPGWSTIMLKTGLRIRIRVFFRRIRSDHQGLKSLKIFTFLTVFIDLSGKTVWKYQLYWLLCLKKGWIRIWEKPIRIRNPGWKEIIHMWIRRL